MSNIYSIILLTLFFCSDLQSISEEQSNRRMQFEINLWEVEKFMGHELNRQTGKAEREIIEWDNFDTLKSNKNGTCLTFV